MEHMPAESRNCDSVGFIYIRKEVIYMNTFSELNKESGDGIEIACEGDLSEILALQKLAYKSEAEIYNDYTIPPLVQTMEDLKEEAKESIILKFVEDEKIVGSVRTVERDGTCYIGKLIVHPHYQNKGIGKKLLKAVEKYFGAVRCELFTGHLSVKNLALYEKLGYKRFKLKKINDSLQFVYLEKIISE